MRKKMKIQTTCETSTADSATNACRLCAPLGAAMVFAGIANCVPFLHGSQGCATYIRRYMISHFREPVDIASSSFSEEDAVFGGAKILLDGIRNVCLQYKPDVIGVATTCLSETIGEDVERILAKENLDGINAVLVPVSTPSYSGSHIEGFNRTCKAVVEKIVPRGKIQKNNSSLINVFPGMLSPADLREIRRIVSAFGVKPIILPDYSETLDGGAWDDYMKIQPGGTPLDDIKLMGNATATLEFGATLRNSHDTAGCILLKKNSVPRICVGTPIGLRETDNFIAALEETTGRQAPAELKKERLKLLDTMVDGHKIVSSVPVAVFGDADMVIGITSFLVEIGAKPEIIACGSKEPEFESEIKRVCALGKNLSPNILNGADHEEILELMRDADIELAIGNSKGYKNAKKMAVPLIRIGFPIHDRFGAQRTLHIGYQGAMRLYDEIANTIIQKRQEGSDVGYTYF